MVNIEDYKYQRLDKEVAYVPLDGSSRLLVMFSSHNGGDRFMQCKSLLENQKCNLFFITDPNNSFYLEDDKGHHYHAVLNEVVRMFHPKNVFFAGSSMGAYGALHHALRFGVNAILSNPQVTHKDTYDNTAGSLLETLQGGVTLLDNTVFLKDKEVRSFIWYTYGSWLMDVANAKSFMNAVPESMNFMMEKRPEKKHMYFFEDVEEIYKRMDLITEAVKALW